MLPLPCHEGRGTAADLERTLPVTTMAILEVALLGLFTTSP